MKTATQKTKRERVATSIQLGMPDAHGENGFPSHDLVAQRAYEIWQRHGCPQGTEFQDWLAAEAELRSRR